MFIFRRFIFKRVALICTNLEINDISINDG